MNTILLLCGFVITFLLNFSCAPDPPLGQEQNRNVYLLSESGLMNPQPSLQKHMSADGWHAGERSVLCRHVTMWFNTLKCRILS